jgi:uncharacterized protein (DUF169 family)
MDLSIFHEYGEELEKRLRLQTFPLAIKLLEKEGDIPEEATRPKRDLGEHLALCQGFATSRREGTTIAMLKEDMECFEPVVGYGIEEPPQYFLEGNNRYPHDVATLEAGANYAHEFPRLQYGKYIGVVSAPSAKTVFEPDVVTIYCNSEQLSLLLLGRECQDGFNLKCSLSSHAACVYAIVPAIQSGNYQVAIPCRGDRYFYGIAGDDEMIFTAPKEKLEELMMGLRYVHESGSRLPRAYGKGPPDFEGESPYVKIGRMLGMEV